MSARPSMIGSTSLGMSWPEYWLSPSVLTMTSAPSFRHASSPAWKPAARPLLFVSRTMWSTPCSRATATVRSTDPSSMTSHSTSSKPSTSRGRSASVSGRVSSSLKQGIWMMSFMVFAPAGGPTILLGMSAPTLTRSHPGAPAPARPSPRRWRLSLRTWERLGFAVVVLGALVLFLVYPTYPNYDSVYSLIWGREALHLQVPSFEAYRAPTQHP